MLEETMLEEDVREELDPEVAALRLASASLRDAIQEAAQSLEFETLVEACHEFAQALSAVCRRIVEAVAMAMNDFMIKLHWALETSGLGLGDWWNVYAVYCRKKLRQETDRWRLLRRPAGWLVDRLPDRVAVVLYREVFLY